jgi:hypothetical protein
MADNIHLDQRLSPRSPVSYLYDEDNGLEKRALDLVSSQDMLRQQYSRYLEHQGMDLILWF